MSPSKSAISHLRGLGVGIKGWPWGLRALPFSLFPFSLAFVVLALAGFWAPWLTHPTAALRLSGFDLAEWVTFLPGIRDGSLPLSRLAFLAPLLCLALLLSLAAARTRPLHAGGWRRFLPASALGWGLLALGLICNFLVLPLYEVLRNREYWPEYQAQFIVACAALLGMAICQFLPRRVNACLQIVFALVGGGYGAWALATLRPVANELMNAPWAVGYGWMAMLAGFAGLAGAGGLELLTSLKQKTGDVTRKT